MGIVFANRGTFTARYSNGGPAGMSFGNTIPTTGADGTALSGNSIVFPANNNFKSVTFAGRRNTPNGRAFSLLLRIKPAYSASPAANQGMFCLTAGSGNVTGVDLIHNTAGNLIVLVKNESSASSINSVSAGAWSPVSGTWYDVVITWDGTTTASSFKVYVNAVLIGSITPTSAWTASWTNQYLSAINLGISMAGSVVNGATMDECVIWDSVITPSSVTLVSGTGSLNGSARTSLVDVTAFDGSINSGAGAANIRTGTTETIDGVVVTGTAAIPGAADVRLSVATGATTGTLIAAAKATTQIGVTADDGVGLYDGTDRHTDPGTGNVADGIGYKSNSTTINRTGTLKALTLAQFLALK